MRKFISILITLLLITGILSACSFKSNKQDIDNENSKGTINNSIEEDSQPTSSINDSENKTKKE